MSLGDYVLTGGELAAAVVIDAVARLLPGVLGDESSHVEDSFTAGLLDCPQYTRPEVADGLAGAGGAARRRPRGDPALAPEASAGAHLAEAAGAAGGSGSSRPRNRQLLAEFKAEWRELNSQPLDCVE